MARYTIQTLRASSFKNMYLDVGGLFVNLKLKGGETAEEVAEEIEEAMKDGRCLGATTGGISFATNMETRSIEADGKRGEFVGSTVIDSFDATISSTIKEFTLDNLEKVLPTAVRTETGSLKSRLSILESDYIDSLWTVGNRNDDALIGIKLENALNTSDVTLQTEDKGEGTIAVEYKAHAGDLHDSQYAPFEIFEFLPESA